jgi:cell fate (sporulation/competence/biofilm development) regulator YlbF (YheA/YmcA/DUF963 family)
MKQSWLEATYKLVDEIKENHKYKRLLELREKMEQDDGLKELIHTFKIQNEKYQEVKQYSNFHPDLNRVQLEFSKAKEALYSNEIIREYKNLEKELQALLDGISKEISSSVSKKIKHPNEIGLIQKH